MPWKAEFYPPELDSKDYLSFYSSRFDFVEINLGEGYRQNDGSMRNDTTYSFLSKYARVWSERTPDNFRFSIRIPKTILFTTGNTSPNFADREVSSSISADSVKLGEFLEKLAPIEEKVTAVTIDVPSNLTLASGRAWLELVLNMCSYHGYTVALQFSHTSWFQDLTYNMLERHGASVIWPYDISRPLSRITITADFIYLRSRNYHYADSNSSAKNEGSIKQQLSSLIDTIKERVQEENSLEYAIIVTSHPTQAVLIRDVLNIPQRAGSFTLSAAAAPPSTTSSYNGVDRKAAVNTSELGGNVSQREADNRRIIVCVDLNAFYPSCEELRNTSLKGKPHAVIMTDQKEGSITKGVVSSCSYEARKYGVRSAMGLSRAKLLCPDLILLPVDISYYSKVSEQVMSVLEPFADVLEQASIDEAFLDCTSKIIKEKDNIAALEQFGMSIKKAVKDKCGGLLCSIGIAPTKSAAKIASDYKKPDGLTVVPANQLKPFLAPLEVSTVAGIGPKTERALKEMGITTLGQLASADVQKLQERFGKNGYWMWRVANGTDGEPVQPRGDHVSISTESTLESFTRDKEKIRSLLFSLADEIYERAAIQHGYTFRTVGVKLVRTDFTVETRETTFAEQQDGKNSITSVIAPLLEKFTLSKEEAAVRKVGLRLSHLSRKASVSGPENLKARLLHSTAQKTLLDYI
jgi:DNA polymerase IV (archaeal DinB-like DNA polymerase)